MNLCTRQREKEENRNFGISFSNPAVVTTVHRYARARKNERPFITNASFYAGRAVTMGRMNLLYVVKESSESLRLVRQKNLLYEPDKK